MSKGGVDKREVGKLFPQNTWPNLASLSPGTGTVPRSLGSLTLCVLGWYWAGLCCCALVQTMPCVAGMAHVVNIMAPNIYCIALFVGNASQDFTGCVNFAINRCFLHIHLKIPEIDQVGVST